MSLATENYRRSIVDYCSFIGCDPLLVQGAGGNVSWKDGGTLWIKASGTWLADANSRDIFVPVDLEHLQAACLRRDFTVVPIVCSESDLKPSIETLLHALMPQRVVIHLHAVDILAYLVCDNYVEQFQLKLDTSICWVSVEYHKPGRELAAAVATALGQEPKADVVFLKNHGVVIGGETVADVTRIMSRLISKLGRKEVYTESTLPASLSSIWDEPPQYIPVQDPLLHQLAINSDLFDRLESDWALYPDHVVFLGARAYAYKSIGDYYRKTAGKDELPELVFIHGAGVFASPALSQAKLAQLRCYYEVLLRQNTHQRLTSLTYHQIAELLNWDAELYRKNIGK